LLLDRANPPAGGVAHRAIARTKRLGLPR
jgi:hypothetical protein